MAEETGKLTDDSGVLSESDKDIISTVANQSDDTFVERYTDETTDAEETTDDPEQIRSKIEETRKEMSETIDAIQEKLSFQNISEQVSEQVNEAIETAKNTVYDATIRKVGNFMRYVSDEMTNVGKELSKTPAVKSAMRNPVPFALIGLGAGILLLNSYGKKGSSRYGNGRNYDYDSRRNEGNSASMLKSAGDKVSGVASTTYDGVTSAAQQAYEGVASTASTAYNSVGSAANVAYEKVGDIGTQAKEQYEYYIEENPLAVGAVAFAVGAAVGFAIPSTDYENELMGEARQNLLQKAQSTAGTLVDKAKQVASEASQTFKEELNSQNSPQ